jgi:uncharacterized SAM-binding protein YcdF (DUF218 family)
MLTATLLTEPVALILFACIASLWLMARARHRIGRTLAILPAILAFLIFATPMGASALLTPLERSATQAAAACSPMGGRSLIVVLAGGASGGSESPSEIERLQLASFRRMVRAVDLSLSAPDSWLLISGTGRGTAREDQLLKSLALHLGYPSERLLVEGTSRDTFESARAVKEAMRRQGFDRVELVTTATHMPRALASYRREGLVPCARPTDFKRVDVYFPSSLMPQISALQKTTEALHEYLGWASYRLTGKL